MPDISGILDMGRRALSAHQRAIAVVSHNIANVNTDGYSRQDAIYSPSAPHEGFFGTGVELRQVRRVVDRFLENQIASEQSTFGRLAVEKGLLNRVESILNDASDEGITQAMNDFFAAVGDVANNPSGGAERIVLIERGRHLAQRIRATDEQFRVIRQDADSEIQQRVLQINTLSSKIADLNLEIRRVENTGEGAHDLRDERTRLVKALSEEIGIEVFDQGGNGLTVTTGSLGRTYPLVLGDRAYSLSTVSDPDHSGLLKVVADTDADITGAIDNGRLKGLIALRDDLLPAFTDRLDKLAASIVNEFNLQHKAGFSLDGETGLDFFSPLIPTVLEGSANTGTAVVTATVAALPDPLDPFAPPAPPPLSFDPYVLSFSQGEYTLRNRTTGAKITTTDTEITFEGITVRMDGDMVNGDRFDIRFHQDAARNMAVAFSDPNKIAAASSALTLPGDNTNAMRLAALQDRSVASLKQATFQEFYGGFVADVGARVQESERNLSVQEVFQEKLAGLRDEVQGVSLDEEMTRLIQFQRAYQASARLVTTADELLDTIIGLKR